MLYRCALRVRPSRIVVAPYGIRYNSQFTPRLIRIDKATFYKRFPSPADEEKGDNPPLFKDLDFEIQARLSPSTEPRHWAIIGSPGKSTLLEILRGQHLCLPPTARSYPYLSTDEIAAKDPRLRSSNRAIQYVGFAGEGSEATGGTRGAYLSARYESLKEATDWTVLEYLTGRMSLNPLESEETSRAPDEKSLSQVINDLELEKLLEMPVANLSNGQTRRARIAKALLNNPELLVLEDPFMGLDPDTVRKLNRRLQLVAQNSTLQMIMTLRTQDTIPDWVTDVVVVGHSNNIMWNASKGQVETDLAEWKWSRHAVSFGSNRGQGIPWIREKWSLGADEDPDERDVRILFELTRLPMKPSLPDPKLPPEGEPLIEMYGVRVKYGDKAALGEWNQRVWGEQPEGLHWTVRRGQRWAILGPNGSGKTTLVSLITSDHPQAYAQPVKLFGRSRLPEPGQPAISLFELQSRIGHSSPEIHAFFPRQLSIRAAIESAFADTFLSKPKLDYEKDLDVSAVLRHFRSELAPNDDLTTDEDLNKIADGERDPLPPIGKANRTDHFYGAEEELDYADTVRFGDLSPAQQRLVLFIRALVHRPDIVILDEALSGLSANIRDKCLAFLDYGQTQHKENRYVITGTTNQRGRVQYRRRPVLNPIRFTGLSPDQALLVISHVADEIPVRCSHYMVLPPGGQNEGDDGMQFRTGPLMPESSLRDEHNWNTVWNTQAEYRHELLRRAKRSDKINMELFGDDYNFVLRQGFTDGEKYHWAWL